MIYLPKHVKRDPVSGAVAIRTVLDDSSPQLAGLAWVVVTAENGSRTTSTVEVDGWEDLHDPAGPP